MKKIAFILQVLTGGGAERTVANLSFELAKKYDVYIILFNGKKVSYPHNAKIIDLNLPLKESKAGKVLNVFKRAAAIKKIKKQYEFDCVVSFMFGANLVNVLSKSGEKVITSARNYLSSYGLTRYNILKERFISKHSDVIVAISEMVRFDLIEHFGIEKDKIITIYNPCDSERVKNKACEEPAEKLSDGKFRFINVGRTVKQKGQWHLLKAFSRFAEDKNDVELLILGSGQLEPDLKALSEKLGISDKVSFKGFVDNPFSFVARSDAFVLSSLHEGLGNVLLEALACDIPVISTDCLAGPREILAPESDYNISTDSVELAQYGILTKCPDNKGLNTSTDLDESDKYLAEAMQLLYENHELQQKYKTSAHKRIEAFDPQKISSQWFELFENLTGD